MTNRIATSGPAKLRWVCPICGASAMRLAPGGRAESVALNALRSHVRVSTGNGHGPSHAYPADVDPDALDAGVELMDV